MSEDLGDTQEVSVQLSEPERELLRAGALQWFGPARPTQELATAMGFADVPALRAEMKRLRDRITPQSALSPLDWTRLIVATEIAFISDVFGAGFEWSTTSGIPDAEALSLLRSLQRRLVGTYAPMVGNGLGTR